jgi:hypothetical protein
MIASSNPAPIRMRAEIFSSSDVMNSIALTTNIARLQSASMIAACREDCQAVTTVRRSLHNCVLDDAVDPA